MKKRTMIPVLVTAGATALIAACGAGSTGTKNPARATRPAARVTHTAGPSPGATSASAPSQAPPSSPARSPARPPSPAAAGQYLATLSPVADSGDLFTGGSEVNGQYYANSIALPLNPGPENVSYNLARRWQRLVATVGLQDDSTQNEEVQLQVIADGRIIYNHVFTLGQSKHIDLNVSDVLRLELVATLESSYTGQVTPVWGNAGLTG